MNALVVLSSVALLLALLFFFRALLERCRWKSKMGCCLIGISVLTGCGAAGMIHPAKVYGIPIQVGGCVYTQDQPIVCN